MLHNEPKIETVKDYPDNTKATLEWCKQNLTEAKKNPSLGRKYTRKLRARLAEGIWITNNETGNKIFKRFDYPEQYIKNVMNPGINQWNKWVILCARDYVEDEFEDVSNLSVYFNEERIVKKIKHRIIKYVSVREKLLRSGKIKEGIYQKLKLKSPIIK